MLINMNKISLDAVRTYILEHNDDKYLRVSKLKENQNLNINTLNLNFDKIVYYKDGIFEETTIYYLLENKEYRIIGVNYIKNQIDVYFNIKELENKSTCFLTSDYLQKIYLKLLIYGDDINIKNSIQYFNQMNIEYFNTAFLSDENRLIAIDEEREMYIHKIAHLVSIKCMQNAKFIQLSKLEKTVKKHRCVFKKEYQEKNKLLDIIKFKKNEIKNRECLDLLNSQSPDIKYLVSNNYDNFYLKNTLVLKK